MTTKAGCRRRFLPTAGPPMPLRSSSAGDSIEPQATTTVGASTVSAVVEPSACVTVASTPGGAAVLDQDPVGVAADDAPRAGVGGVLQPGLHRRALAALLAAHRAVAAELGVVVERRVAPDRAVLVAERVAGLRSAAGGCRSASSPRCSRRCAPSTTSMWSRDERRVVEPLEPVRRPLGQDRARRADAVHVVDDRAAAERRAGEDRDRARLGGGQAAAVVELEVAGQLELLEVGLVAVARPSRARARTCPPSRTRRRSRAPPGARADHAHVGRQRGRRRPRPPRRVIVFGASLGGGRRRVRARDSRSPPSSGSGPASSGSA